MPFQGMRSSGRDQVHNAPDKCHDTFRRNQLAVEHQSLSIYRDPRIYVAGFTILPEENEIISIFMNFGCSLDGFCEGFV